MPFVPSKKVMANWNKPSFDLVYFSCLCCHCAFKQGKEVVELADVADALYAVRCIRPKATCPWWMGEDTPE